MQDAANLLSSLSLLASVSSSAETKPDGRKGFLNNETTKQRLCVLASEINWNNNWTTSSAKTAFLVQFTHFNACLILGCGVEHNNAQNYCDNQVMIQVLEFQTETIQAQNELVWRHIFNDSLSKLTWKETIE